jgi:ABC-type transport system involved in cytochrome c biogenesis permease subunit
MIAAAAFLIILASAIIQVVFLLRKSRQPDPVSPWLLGLAALALFATLVQRSIQIRFAALTNTYESLLFFSAAICTVLFIMRVQASGKLRPGGNLPPSGNLPPGRTLPPSRNLPPAAQFGATLVCIVLLALSSSPLAPRGVQPPIPALRSLWLALHVAFSFAGEAFFAVSFAAAISWFAARRPEAREDLDRLVATSIGIGYPVFTAGALIFGAVWAETAWGSWWSWDPKETWALVTWLIYTAYLHVRLVRKVRGAWSAALAIAGFAAAAFTFFGVNYLLSGFHSYR